MEENIGFDNIETVKKKTPKDIVASFAMLLMVAVIASSLMYLYLLEKGSSSKKSDITLNSDYYMANKVSFEAGRNTGETSVIMLPDETYESVKVLKNVAAKSVFIIAKRKTDVEGNGDINQSDIIFNENTVSMGENVSGTFSYTSTDSYIVELDYNDYYHFENDINDNTVSIVDTPINKNSKIVILDISKSSYEIAENIAGKINMEDTQFFIIGNEIQSMDTPMYLDFAKNAGADYYIKLSINQSEEDANKLNVNAFCNSQYFIPNENSVTLTDSILETFLESRLYNIEGVSECEDGSIIKMLEIPATEIDISYGTEMEELLLQEEYEHVIVNAIKNAVSK